MPIIVYPGSYPGYNGLCDPSSNYSTYLSNPNTYGVFFITYFVGGPEARAMEVLLKGREAVFGSFKDLEGNAQECHVA